MYRKRSHGHYSDKPVSQEVSEGRRIERAPDITMRTSQEVSEGRRIERAPDIIMRTSQ